MKKNKNIELMILDDIIDNIEYSINNGYLDRYTLQVIYEMIFYEYCILKCNMSEDDALDFSIKYFNDKFCS